MDHLLPEAAAAVEVGADVGVLAFESGSEECGAELAADAGIDVEGFSDEDERGVDEEFHGLRIGDVEGGLVDEADGGAGLVEVDDGIEGAVEGFAEGDDVAAVGGCGANDVVFAGGEGVAGAKEEGAVVFEYVRDGAAGGEDKAEAGVFEDFLEAGGELMLVCGEVEAGVVVIGQAVGGEHVVDAEVAGVVGHVIAAGV